MIEAICETCDETFIPFDEQDTEHSTRSDGSICGGAGRILGQWKTGGDNEGDGMQIIATDFAEMARKLIEAK